MHGEFAPGLRRKILVLRPALPHLFLFFRRELLQCLVLLARSLPLRRRERCPGFHLRLDALLFIRRHFRIALRDAAPFLLALRLQAIPLGCERRKHGLFLRCELRPGRRAHRDLCGRDGRNDGGKDGNCQGDRQRGRQRSSLASQFRNPRST